MQVGTIEQTKNFDVPLEIFKISKQAHRSAS
jgi:hypothetical protein